jgi:hypothetical protein
MVGLADSHVEVLMLDLNLSWGAVNSLVRIF